MDLHLQNVKIKEGQYGAENFRIRTGINENHLEEKKFLKAKKIGRRIERNRSILEKRK